MRMNIQKRPKPPKTKIDTKDNGFKMYLLLNKAILGIHVLVFGGVSTLIITIWTPKNFRDRKVTPLIFLNIALWSALRKVSDSQWSNQNVRTQRGFQSHPLDQTTASLTLNFGWFQRTKKNITIAMHPSISAKTLQKKNIKTSCINSRQKTSYSTSICSRSICLKNRTKFEISSFLKRLHVNLPGCIESTHLDPWCFGQFSHHIFTTRWPRHLSAAQSPSLRGCLLSLPIVPPFLVV